MTKRSVVAGVAVLAALATAGAFGRSAERRTLWFEGRAVSWSGAHGVVLRSGGQLLEFSGEVPRPLLLRADARELLEAAAGPGGAVWVVDASGSVLARHDDGTLTEIGRTPFDIPTLSFATDGRLWAVRSARQFSFRPESTGSAVAVRLDAALQGAAKAGRAITPANPFLAQLANSGHVLALEDGGVTFAPFIRDSVIRFDAAGTVRWATARGLSHATPSPTLRVARESGGRPDVRVDYAPVNLGMTLGPDGRIYVLSTPEATTTRSRLYAFDATTGAVQGTWDFDTALPTITVDRRGRVRTADPARLLPSADPGRRVRLDPFDLPSAAGDGRIRSADFAGRPLLINLWASWCGPCRTEMPALDSLVRSYGGRLGFAALSDDINDDDARGFLRANGFTFPAALGGGRLKARYHYVGLPHTILVDAEGGVVYQWTGYAGDTQLRAIAALVDAELERTPLSVPADNSHHH